MEEDDPTEEIWLWQTSKSTTECQRQVQHGYIWALPIGFAILEVSKDLGGSCFASVCEGA